MPGEDAPGKQSRVLRHYAKLIANGVGGLNGSVKCKLVWPCMFTLNWWTYCRFWWPIEAYTETIRNLKGHVRYHHTILTFNDTQLIPVHQHRQQTSINIAGHSPWKWKAMMTFWSCCSPMTAPLPGESGWQGLTFKEMLPATRLQSTLLIQVPFYTYLGNVSSIFFVIPTPNS